MGAATPAGQGDWPFVARREELAVLTDVIVGSGDLSTWPRGGVVVAPAGVGKSRLLREVQRSAAGRGLPTSTVIGTRAAATIPYGAMLHLLPSSARERHSDVTSWYGAMVGRLREIHHGRLLLVVDDAQLLDPGSAELLLHLVLEGVAAPLVAVRRGEQVSDAVTTLWKDGYALRVDLQPFSRRETRELIGAALGGEVSARTADLLARMAQGNVLYAKELVTGAVQSGSLRQVDGMWQWDGQIVLAPRLLDAVGQRLSGLRETDQETLALLALGEPLALPVAERIVDPDSLARVEGAGLIRLDASDQNRSDPNDLRLQHPLYGEVVLAEIKPLTRRRLLRRLADALEADGLAKEGAASSDQDVLRIASWRLAAGGAVPAQTLSTAASRANRAFDHALAERLARAAIDRGAGVVASTELGRALAGQSRHAEAEQVLGAAESAVLAVDDAHLHQRYLSCRFGALYLGLGQRDEMVALLDRFVAAHKESDPAHQAAAYNEIRGYRANIDLDDGRAERVLERVAPVLADDNAWTSARLLALETTGEALAYLGRHRQAAQVQQQLRRLSLGQGMPEAEAVDVAKGAAEATLQSVLCATLNGEPAVALPMVSGIHDALLHSPDATNRGLSALALGKTLLLQGKPLTARRYLIDAVSAFRTAEVGGSRSWALSMLVQTAALTGDREAAKHWLSESRAAALPRWIARSHEEAVAAEVWTSVLDGDSTGAARIAVEGADALGDLLLSQATLLHLSVRVGGSTQAVRRRLQHIAAQSECDFPGLLADHVAAISERDAEGLERAGARFAERGLPLRGAEAAAQASLRYAEIGSAAASTRTAIRSRQLIDQCEGAWTPLLLTELKELPRLSRREREVARLAASGMSNAAIADRLVLSVRTVESHLYQVYGKLGVERREDLRRYLGDTASNQ